jgi:DNA-binding NarL/FixJ family response regulator
MNVILVGSREERARLRASLNGAIRVVGEFLSLTEAEAAGLEVDGILVSRGVRLKRDDEALQEPLTPREIQVLELLAEGLPNKAIAGRLGISDQTAKFHVASISGKLGAANRTDAVRRAVRRGLITL